MKKIFILGAGCWGSTLATVYAEKGFKVTLWEPISENLEYIKLYRKPKFFKYVKIPPQVHITSKIEEIKNADVIFLVTPSIYVNETLSKLEPLKKKLNNKILISCVKGFEPTTLKTISTTIYEKLKIEMKQIFVFSGPSHAEEVAMGKPTAIVLAGINYKFLKILQKMLSTEIIRVYTNDDIIGVEVAGATKNVYAIAAGICDGLNLGNNAKSALLTRSIKEMVLIGKYFGAKITTFFGLAGIGDLLTTAYSSFSRNRTFGEYLALYKNVNIAKTKIKTSIEGYNTSKVLHIFSEKNKLDLPIAEEVYKIIYKNSSPENAIKNLLSRPLKEEFSWLD
ncbi:MAG: NAD(P)-dependent glycerol-3-phosphate dehydrogenase [Endomicrobia bacterium]|nr:NAD(P)-dependent glycerol-3-phosphate dehydrogenase [Endomicrobiia bacterium]MCX7941076.1 NAD(P)-dependent glycerol-3-phosphate dehydrogenase [Endomicrobiia bacterium]MDW8055378.1 NAD(P)H-dependent glycerol-3-phosphate dehydrogenase [Elusimicrobiota bacterium]